MTTTKIIDPSLNCPIKNKRKGRRGSEQYAWYLYSALTEHSELTYSQALMNLPFDKNTGLQPTFSITVEH